MNWERLKMRSHFYASLWRLYLRYPKGIRGASQYSLIPPDTSTRTSLENRRVHFWVPHQTPGSQFILWEVIPELIKRLKTQIPSFELSISDSIPSGRIDVLFSFKEPIPPQNLSQIGHSSLVICDEADRLWNVIETFDSVICTSSLELAALLRKRASRVLMIPEVEPSALLEASSRRLSVTDINSRQSILWHGGLYTLKELREQLRFFETLHHHIRFDKVIVVCGNGLAPSDLKTHPLFEFRAWSRDALIKAANECRLAILPARLSLKLSYLKPASRLRCMFALGCVALGDARVPEVVRLSERLRMPIIPFSRPVEAADRVAKLWKDHPEICRIQRDGYQYVTSEHGIDRAMNRWINAMIHVLPSSAEQ
jgi:hypothetical protein